MKQTFVRVFALALTIGLALPLISEADPGRRKRDKRYDDHSSYDRDDRDHRGYDGHDRYRGRQSSGYNYYDSRGHFNVPRKMGHDHHKHYQPFYYGTQYYAPHSHQHSIYRFPVATAYGPMYRPYAYCESSFYASGYFGPRGPSFGLSFRF